jgi:hypothetical protein
MQGQTDIALLSLNPVHQWGRPAQWEGAELDHLEVWAPSLDPRGHLHIPEPGSDCHRSGFTLESNPLGHEDGCECGGREAAWRLVFIQEEGPGGMGWDGIGWEE